MKRVLFILFLFISCNLFPENVRFVWYDNPPADSVLTYIIYKAEGNDSTNMTLVPIDTIADIWSGGNCEYVTSFDSSYIQAAISATNRHGTSELSDATKKYSRGELLVPSKPSMATIPIIIN